MGKNGNPGTCYACGRKEEKEGFLFGAARRLYYCIAPHCSVSGRYFCYDCRWQMSKEHTRKDKCPNCDFGHMKCKDDWQ